MKKQKYDVTEDIKHADLDSLRAALDAGAGVEAGTDGVADDGIYHDEYEAPVLSPKNLAENAFIGTYDAVNHATFGVSTLTIAAALGDFDMFAGTNSERSFAEYRKRLEEAHKPAAFLGSLIGDAVPFAIGAVSGGTAVPEEIALKEGVELATKKIEGSIASSAEREAEERAASSIASQADNVTQPFLTGTSGYFYKALRTPRTIAEKIPEVFSSEAMANVMLNKNVAKYMDTGLQGAIYGGFSGLASGINDEDMYNGFSLDSFKHVAQATLFSSVIGAGFGVGAHAVGDIFKYGKDKFFTDAQVDSITPRAKQGVSLTFDLALEEVEAKIAAAKVAGDHELVSSLERNKKILAGNKSQFEKDTETVQKYSEKRSKNETVSAEEDSEAALANHRLDSIIHNDSDLKVKAFSSSDPVDISEVAQRAFTESNERLKQEVGERLDARNKKVLSPEDYEASKGHQVNVREDSVDLLDDDIHRTMTLYDERYPAVEAIHNSFFAAEPLPQGSSIDLQRSAATNTVKSLTARLDRVNRIGNKDFLKNKDLSNTYAGKAMKGANEELVKRALTEEKGGLPGVYDAFLNDARTHVVALGNLVKKGETQDQIFNALIKTVQDLNNSYKIAKLQLPQNTAMTAEVNKIHKEMISIIKQQVGNPALFGKLATKRADLFAARRLIQRSLSDIRKLLKAPKGQEVVRARVYDHNAGKYEFLPPNVNDISPSRIGKTRLIGNATGDVELRKALGDRYRALYEGFAKESEISMALSKERLENLKVERASLINKQNRLLRNETPITGFHNAITSDIKKLTGKIESATSKIKSINKEISEKESRRASVQLPAKKGTLTREINALKKEKEKLIGEKEKVVAEKTKLKSKKDSNAVKKTKLKADQLETAAKLEELAKEERELSMHTAQLAGNSMELQIIGSRVENTVATIKEHNSNRSQAYAEFMMRAAEISRVRPHLQEATSKITPPGAGLHHGSQRNLKYEAGLGIRDFFTGNYAGTFKAASWYVLAAVNKVANKVMAVQKEMNMDSDDLFLWQKHQMLNRAEALNKKTLQSKIRTKRGEGNKKNPNYILPAISNRAGSYGEKSVYNSDDEG